MITKVECEIRLTEDPEKVKLAVRNVFEPEREMLTPLSRGYLYTAIGEGSRPLRKLYNLLRTQRILDAAREHLKRGTIRDTVVFYLHKQAAYMGIVAFCTVPEKESPLGAIEFTVKTDDVEAFIDWLAPRTVQGRPVGEAPPPDP
ncbi:MAG: hypothetical protein DRJ49_04330 [Thermoprotei archaeon]|nr:MAG: hypothetical protein DRJ49_04330 [Thermoprotei archaeon]